MDKGQRKRRAVIGAIALLEWRDRMAREDAKDRMARETADRETMMRYERMIAQMRAQADAPRAARQTTCVLVKGMVHGNGAAGALS
jgi:hypothetical protein